MTAVLSRPSVVALLPPVAWLAHLTLTYLVEETVCSTGLRTWDVLGASLVGTAIVVLTAVFVAGAVLGTVSGARLRSAAGADETSDPPAGRRAFLGLAGAVLGPLFAAAILLQATPLLFVGPCQ